MEDKDKKILGVQKNVFLLSITSFLNDFSNEMILSVFPAFFISVLKSGAASLGLVEGLADFAANFIKIISGQISDKIQKRKIFAILGYSISVAIRPFYILTGRIGQVLWLRLTDRIGKGLREAPRDALISLSIHPKEAGRSFGFHRAMDTLGGILGPLLGYLILRKYPGDFNKIFMLAFLIGILAILSLFFIKEIKGVVRNKDFRFAKFNNLSKRFKVYILSVFILSAGSMPVAVLLLKTQDIGLLIASIPLYYMVYSIAYSVFSYIAGKSADRYGDNKVIVLGYLFLIIGYVVLSNSTSATILLFGFILLGLFSALTDGIHRSYTSRLVEEGDRSSAYGFLNGISGFGAIIAGILGGYIWQHSGSSVALLLSSIIIVLGLTIFIFTQFKKEKS